MPAATYPLGVCQTVGCDRPLRARGACFRHDPGRPEPQSYEERLFAKIDATGDCWLWTGAPDTQGYGHFHDTPRTTTGAHRAVYELLVGPVPDDLHLDHLCKVRLCVNPDHLEPVTPAENVKRALSWARCKSGHLFTTATTAISATTGRRRCRTCYNAWTRRFRLAQRVAA